MDRRQFIASSCLILLGPKCLPSLIPDCGKKIVELDSMQDLVELYNAGFKVMPNGKLLCWIKCNSLWDGRYEIEWKTTDGFTRGYRIGSETYYKPVYDKADWPKLIRS